ncbi:hypothetical protein [Salinisphaera sp. Q1T1-3]|uniref:hypothetical protein n=1 Tax=Salinisphaera sp. Q1T1-3 TaxID=2321229 RepID=UPI000E727183|nr:hypothetical protein [Salinisphaera sp. Q1T1-3]RJS94085.1 hypothetical protein D3260_05820 [Salinisphaera sp. Q1T1-3]
MPSDPSRFLPGLALALVLLAAGLPSTAAALQITTDWHEEPHADPQGQLAAPVLAAAVRNDDHIYELHLICGTDQYNGNDDSARMAGPVLELAVSSFNGDESHAAYGGDADTPYKARLAFGRMSPVTQPFRRDGYPNVISVAFGADTPLAGKPAAQRLATAARAGQSITIGGLIGHETVRLPISTENDRVAAFLKACPLTRAAR